MGNVVHRFTLGSKTDSELGIQLVPGIEDPIAASTRDRRVAIPGKPGSYDFGADLSHKVIRLPIEFVDCTTQAELQTAIRTLADHLLDDDGKPEEMELSFSWEPTKFYTVRYSGSAAIDRKVETGRGVLEFVAHDPFAHSETKTTTGTYTASPGTVTVTNSGTLKTGCTIVLTNNSGAAISGFTLTRQQEG